MPVDDPAAANTSLWSAYLHDGWGRLLDPLGQRQVADAIAAGIAGWLNFIVAPQIAAVVRRERGGGLALPRRARHAAARDVARAPQYRREEPVDERAREVRASSGKGAAIPSGR